MYAKVSEEQVKVVAPAKVNLWLKVLHHRPDGYHEIASLLQTIDLSDRLEFRLAGGGRVSIRVSGPRSGGVPADESNLAVKAALLLKGRFGIEAGAEIFLWKEIPPGAGLGGGSSDAAATLIGCSRLWGLDIGIERLNELAAELGSDVPFFLRGGTALCTGRGERVTPIASVGVAHLVLVPGRPLSTAEVYKRWDSLALTGTYQDDIFYKWQTESVDLCRLSSIPPENSLESAAFELMPCLKEIKALLASKGASRVMMTGSGSCIFGAARSAEEAVNIAEAVRRYGLEAIPVETVGPREWSSESEAIEGARAKHSMAR